MPELAHVIHMDTSRVYSPDDFPKAAPLGAGQTAAGSAASCGPAPAPVEIGDAVRKSLQVTARAAADIDLEA